MRDPMPRGPASAVQQPPRLLIALDAMWGSWLLSPAPRRLSSQAVDRWPVSAFVRLLGVRQLAQAALISACPTRTRIFAGAALDALHAMSMLTLAGTSRRMSEPALVSAAAASLLSCYGLHCGLRRR